MDFLVETLFFLFVSTMFTFFFLFVFPNSHFFSPHVVPLFFLYLHFCHPFFSFFFFQFCSFFTFFSSLFSLVFPFPIVFQYFQCFFFVFFFIVSVLFLVVSFFFLFFFCFFFPLFVFFFLSFLLFFLKYFCFSGALACIIMHALLVSCPFTCQAFNVVRRAFFLRAIVFFLWKCRFMGCGDANTHVRKLHDSTKTSQHATRDPTTQQQGWRYGLVSPWRLDHTCGSRQDIHSTRVPIKMGRLWMARHHTTDNRSTAQPG